MSNLAAAAERDAWSLGVHDPDPLDSQSPSRCCELLCCSELGIGMSSAPVEKRRGVESNRPVSRSKELRRTGARARASPRIERPRRSGVELPLRLSIVCGYCYGMIGVGGMRG